MPGPAKSVVVEGAGRIHFAALHGVEYLRLPVGKHAMESSFGAAAHPVDLSFGNQQYVGSAV
jgi:hypothetical protein